MCVDPLDSWYIYYGTVGRRMQIIFAWNVKKFNRKKKKDVENVT